MSARQFNGGRDSIGFEKKNPSGSDGVGAITDRRRGEKHLHLIGYGFLLDAFGKKQPRRRRRAAEKQTPTWIDGLVVVVLSCLRIQFDVSLRPCNTRPE